MASSAYGKPSLVQAEKNAMKIAQTLIRLKHSLAADNELNEVMPILQARLQDMAQSGRLPALTMSQIEEIVGGDDE